MNKRLIEVRIQNIIDLDKAINRQLAIKTKSINNKLQQHGESTAWLLGRLYIPILLF